jgi:hypothetical protein
MASPMNLRISPPFASTASHIRPKYWLGSSISASRVSTSDRPVKPRKSQSQITARTVSPMPRLICPSRTRSPDWRPIGIEQRPRRASQRLYLEIERDGGDHRFEQRDLVVGESSGPRSGERERLAHHVIGDVVATQIREDGKFGVVGGCREAATHRLALVGDLDRAIVEACSLAPVNPITSLRGAFAELPKAAELEDLRMQDRDPGRHPRHLDAGPPQARGEAFEKLVRAGGLASLGHQPADDGVRIDTGRDG